MLTLLEKDKAYSIKEFEHKPGKCERSFRQGAATHMARGSGVYPNVSRSHRGGTIASPDIFSVDHSTK
jgi:hypothetical protein